MGKRATTSAAAMAAVALSSYGIAAGTSGPQRRPAATHETFSALDLFDEAEVRVQGRAKACPKAQGRRRFVCGPQDWNWVGPHAGRGAGEVVRCLWVHPHAGGETTLVRWSHAPIGARLRARLLLLEGAGAGATVRAVVKIGGQLVTELRVSDELLPGRAEIALTAGPARDSLSIAVNAPDNRWRLACLQLSMSGRRPGTTRRGADEAPRPRGSGERGAGPEAARAPTMPPVPALALPPGLPEPTSPPVQAPRGTRAR